MQYKEQEHPKVGKTPKNPKIGQELLQQPKSPSEIRNHTEHITLNLTDHLRTYVYKHSFPAFDTNL